MLFIRRYLKRRFSVFFKAESINNSVTPRWSIVIANKKHLALQFPYSRNGANKTTELICIIFKLNVNKMS